MAHHTSIEPEKAFARLMQGNERFAIGDMNNIDRCGAATRDSVLDGQQPFAAVLACADSRVQPSHVFDAGLGELFTCRNAGNLLDELTIGSLEYAVAHTGCPLVVIMGHSSCGASGAAVAWAKNPEESESHNIDDVLRRFSPAVIATMGKTEDDQEWADLAVRKNVILECRQLMQRSQLIATAVREKSIWLVGVVYDLATGTVEVVVSKDEALAS